MAVSYGTPEGLQVRFKGPYGSVAIRAAELEVKAADWKGAVSPFSQVVSPEGITATSLVELQPDSVLLQKMYLEGWSLAAENDGGIVTVYAFGAKPGEDFSLQATMTEVTV